MLLRLVAGSASPCPMKRDPFEMLKTARRSRAMSKSKLAVARNGSVLTFTCSLMTDGACVVRLLATVLSVLVLLLAGLGCQTSKQVEGPVSSEQVAYSNRWLRDNVEVEIVRSVVNERSGLYEVDAWIKTRRIDANRARGFRGVLRAAFYEGSKDNVVDTSAWSEFTLNPENSVRFQSTSLCPADGHLIELAYPEEVGIQ